MRTYASIFWIALIAVFPGILSTTSIAAAEFDDVHASYNNAFSGEIKVGANGSYHANYAGMAAQHAVRDMISEAVVAAQSDTTTDRGDITSGGITVQHGDSKNARPIIIQTTSGTTVVGNRR